MNIDLTNDIKQGMLKAISDIGYAFNKNSLPLDNEEIQSIVRDTLNYIKESEVK